MLTSSVILCTRNRTKDLIACLQSLASQTVAPTELIIVDSSDVPLSGQHEFKKLFCQQTFQQSVLIYMHSKPGLTYQRNRGIERASSQIVYFFDDDTVLEPDYLFQMNRIFQEHPEYAAGLGDISNIPINPSWKYQLFRSFFMLPRQRASGNFTWSGLPTHPYGTMQFKKVEVLGGCCMAFRATVLKEYQFDEQFKGYCYMEDCDIARRISYQYPLFFNPQARLQHLESPLARDKMFDNSAMFMYNYSYLFFKNFYPKNRLKIVMYAWSIVGLFLEALICRQWVKIKGYSTGFCNYIKVLR
jgi:GT2 family glycosyltransferase